MAHTAKEMMNRMKKHPTEEKNIITNHLSKKNPSDKGLTSRFVSSPPKKTTTNESIWELVKNFNRQLWKGNSWKGAQHQYPAVKCKSKQWWDVTIIRCQDKESWMIYTVKYYSANKNKCHSTTCSKICLTGGHYVKWNKLDLERQITPIIPYM